jgi:hypothetical protein
VKSWKARQASARANIARREAVSEVRRRYFELLEQGHSPEEAGRIAQEPPALPVIQADDNAGPGDPNQTGQVVDPGQSDQTSQTDGGGESPGPSAAPPGFRVETYARGWFRVVRSSDGKVMNQKALREDEANALAANLAQGAQE